MKQNWQSVQCLGMAWLILVTSCTMGWCHAHEQVANVSSYRSFCVSANPFTSANPLARGQIGNEFRHCHVLVLGFEFHLEPGQNSLVSLGQLVSTSGDQPFFLCQIQPICSQNQQTVENYWFAAFANQHARESSVSTPNFSFQSSWLFPLSISSLCDLALRTRSGVQQI